jgi:hypothetical protein
MSTINVGGQRLRVAIQPGSGEGGALLLLNGLGANLELFQPFVDALDADRLDPRVDLPGSGESPAPECDTGWAARPRSSSPTKIGSVATGSSW